jgi:hypothetical protein
MPGSAAGVNFMEEDGRHGAWPGCSMRPAGEISTAILGAAERLVRDEGGQRRGPTMQELARHACVGYQAAMNTVKNLTRAGKLEAVAERRVEYRNRPVVEYAPAQEAADSGMPFVDLASVCTAWARG